jgi:hypothetical protein
VENRRRWVLVAFGVVILIIFIGIGAIFAVTAWFQQNLQVDTRTAGEADQEFAAVLAEFPGKTPLLELRDGRAQFTAGHDKLTAVAPARLETLYVLAWDADEERLARFSVPFWLIRMKSTPFRVSAYASGLDDRIQVRAEDIERYGPGIILDTKSPSGDHVLLWAR